MAKIDMGGQWFGREMQTSVRISMSYVGLLKAAIKRAGLTEEHFDQLLSGRGSQWSTRC
jgi:hypothetical protein